MSGSSGSFPRGHYQSTGTSPEGADPVAHGQDRLQAIVIEEPGDLPCALAANYPEFPDSCPWVKLPFFEDVPEVLVDGRTEMSKRSAIRACVSQTVSAANRHSTRRGRPRLSRE